MTTALLAAFALAELGSGVALAAHQRADLARARRIAAEKRAEQAYLRTLQPLVIRVFDAVQPVQDVFDAFSTPRPGLGAARDDVILRSGALAEVKAVAAALRAHPAPVTLRSRTADLPDYLDAMSVALTTLAAASHSKGDRFGWVPAFGTGQDQLDRAESDWSVALGGLDPLHHWPALAENRAFAAGRTTPTRGGFIQAADLACAKAMTDVGPLPTSTAASVLASHFARLAASTRTAIASLGKTAVPPSSRPFGHRLQIELEAARQLPAYLEGFSRAISRQDGVALRAAERGVLGTFPTLREVSHDYDSFGVSLCAAMFNVDDTGHPKDPGLSA